MALLHMFHKWYEAVDTPGTCLQICTLDFSKAFDRIDFNILLQKLINMGIHPVLINWIANFLTDSLQESARIILLGGQLMVVSHRELNLATCSF